MPINRAGLPFIAAFAVVTVVLFLLAEPLGWLGVLATAWCIAFFRDPDRVTPMGQTLVISPADGLVLPVVNAVPPVELGLGTEPRPRVSIFMNVFDVHVNRSPVTGVVKRTAYRPGRFMNASFDKASEDNERMSLAIEVAGAAGPDGATGSGNAEPVTIAVVQIAGLVARRIVCDVSEGSPLQAGQRFGMIRFGSRVDVYLPQGIAPLVAAGQRTIAGETVIADLAGPQTQRLGWVR